MSMISRFLPASMIVFCLVCPGWTELRPLVSPEQQDEKPRYSLGLEAEQSRILKVIVDAQKNCVFMTETQTPVQKAVKQKLKPNHGYQVTVSGEAFLSSHAEGEADPVPGVVVFYCTAAQDGYATQTKVLKPGDVLEFQTPQAKGKHLFLSAFFIDYRPENDNQGQYELAIAAEPLAGAIRGKPSKDAARIMNINFGREPFSGLYDGVIGGPHDVWTLFDVGETRKTALPWADGSVSDVRATFDENDGEWGVADHRGVYHAYLYRQAGGVDLSLRLKHLEPGTYDVYVFAHGDAPDQNGAIEIRSGKSVYTGKATSRDDSEEFRNHLYQEGVQYVKYTIDVIEGKPVVITSKRDGSSLSMFNAVQLKKLD